tara:strand:- start:803 stop:1024 length:222 start_codon:yes stop_codon:yes gene_type:complete
MAPNESDWRKWVGKSFPYKNGINSPKYKEDRDKLFSHHGNGWWWGLGWWNGHRESPMERQRRYKREKEEEKYE